MLVVDVDVDDVDVVEDSIDELVEGMDVGSAVILVWGPSATTGASGTSLTRSEAAWTTCQAANVTTAVTTIHTEISRQVLTIPSSHARRDQKLSGESRNHQHRQSRS